LGLPETLEQQLALLKAIADRPLTLPPVFVDIAGSINAGLLLSQVVYWTKKNSERDPASDGWFWIALPVLQGQLRMGRHELERARQDLKNRRFLESERRGTPPKLFLRANLLNILSAVNNQLSENRKINVPLSKQSKTGKSIVTKPENPNKEQETTKQETKNLFGNSLRSSPANGKSGEAKPVDPRFQAVVKACKQCWPDGVLFDMGPEDGAAINRMLARRHKWTAEELAECIVFRFLSENINPGESIKAWIAAVCDYSTGPRDKFDVPKPDFEYWRKHAKKLLYGEAPEQIPLKPVLTECWHCSLKYDAASRSSLPESEQGFCSDHCSTEYKLWRKESADLGIDMDSLRRKKRSERLAGADS
jgi:hypothetical protein